MSPLGRKRPDDAPAATEPAAVPRPEPTFSDELHTYQSFARVGELYRDSNTGFTGHCTSVEFSEFACERATLETVIDGTLKAFYFDVPRLVHVATNTRGGWSKPGGPTEERNQGMGRDRTPER
jgi:hypothetical protein